MVAAAVLFIPGAYATLIVVPPDRRPAELSVSSAGMTQRSSLRTIDTVAQAEL